MWSMFRASCDFETKQGALSCGTSGAVRLPTLKAAVESRGIGQPNGVVVLHCTPLSPMVQYFVLWFARAFSMCWQLCWPMSPSKCAHGQQPLPGHRRRWKEGQPIVPGTIRLFADALKCLETIMWFTCHMINICFMGLYFSSYFYDGGRQPGKPQGESAMT